MGDIEARQAAIFEQTWADPSLDVLSEALLHARLRRTVAPLHGRVLDVGAGGGLLSNRAGRRVVSADLTHASCRSVAGRGGLAVQADASALPLRDGSFDAITLLDVIEHVPDPAAVLAEVARLVRPGGSVVISCPNAAVPAVPALLWRRALGEWPSNTNIARWDPEHLRRPSIAEVERWVRGAGLEVVASRTWARSAFVVGFTVAAKVGGMLRERCGPARQERGLLLVDRVLRMGLRAADAGDRLLVGDRRSAIVVTGRRVPAAGPLAPGGG